MVKEELSVSTKPAYNKSVFFLLPMLGLPLSYYISNLVNCYIGDISKNEYKQYHIFIEVNTEDDTLRGIQGFVAQYEVKGGTMYVYKVPEEFEEDYLKFILGKYSEFSNDYKARIYKLLRKPFKDSNVYKVLNKSTELKKKIEASIGQPIHDQEVCSIPDMNKEIYG